MTAISHIFCGSSYAAWTAGMNVSTGTVTKGADGTAWRATVATGTLTSATQPTGAGPTFADGSITWSAIYKTVSGSLTQIKVDYTSPVTWAAALGTATTTCNGVTTNTDAGSAVLNQPVEGWAYNCSRYTVTTDNTSTSTSAHYVTINGHSSAANTVTVRAAPGESIADTTGPLCYDLTRGVAWRLRDTGNGTAFFAAGAQYLIIAGIQFDTSTSILDQSSVSTVPAKLINCVINTGVNVQISGGGPGWIEMTNCLMLSTNGSTEYFGALYNNTFVGPVATASTNQVYLAQRQSGGLTPVYGNVFVNCSLHEPVATPTIDAYGNVFNVSPCYYYTVTYDPRAGYSLQQTNSGQCTVYTGTSAYHPGALYDAFYANYIATSGSPYVAAGAVSHGSCNIPVTTAAIFAGSADYRTVPPSPALSVLPSSPVGGVGGTTYVTPTDFFGRSAPNPAAAGAYQYGPSTQMVDCFFVV
jgi:hypothetical protein